MLTHLGDLPQWRGAARVCIDVETRDDQLKKLGPGVRRGAYITGIGFAIDYTGRGQPAETHYLPVRHQGGGNYVDPRQVFNYVIYQAERFDGEIVGANLPYDLDFLAEEGVIFKPSFFRDVQVAGGLLLQPKLEWKKDDDGRRYLAEKRIPMGLDDLAKREGLPGKDETKLKAWAAEHGLDPKSDMWRAPAHIVAAYGMQDVNLPLQLISRQEVELWEQDMQEVWDLESRLLPVLVKMRRRGVRVNLDKVDQIDEMARGREAEAARNLSKTSGIPFDPEDINKAAVLEKHLNADGVKCPRTPTGLPSVKADWLDSLTTPVAEAIKVCRKWNKVRTTFCKSIRTHAIDHGDHYRIHCTFNQLRQETEDGQQKGAGFGRLSSSLPNLQQQPARDEEIGPIWRAIYEPDDGGQWACLDFSSQEPRWITHYAERVSHDPKVRWKQDTREIARHAARECRENPKWDNHSMMAGLIYGDVFRMADPKHAKALRGYAKTIFLGLCYGMGGGKLCAQLGLPTRMVVKDPNAEGWVVYDVGSAEGQKLRAKGARPFEVAGPEGDKLLGEFSRGVPYVIALKYACSNAANKRGYIKTLLGRRCRFPRHPNTGRVEWAHKALNRLIQGTSADQTKLAMVQADEAGFRLQLQVHDELDLTIHTMEEAQQLSQIMVHAVEASVPTRVDIEVGPSWGEIKEAK